MERRAENGGGGGVATENNHETGAFSLPLIAKVGPVLNLALSVKDAHCSVNMSLVLVV